MAVNPLRVLDSKVDGPKLKDAPSIIEFLCDDCRRHYNEFLSYVKTGGLNVVQTPNLVRGLDYYSRTVFEFISPDLGAQSAVAAGGRYDELVEHLGGPITPAVGFALGMDRVVAARAQKKSEGSVQSNPKKAFLVPLSESGGAFCFDVLQKLRAIGIAVPPFLSGKKLKNQMSHAVESGANWAILIGDDELKSQEVTVKNLTTREQMKIKVGQLQEWFLEK
jgi:histidyl-tRNA synthetase